MAPEKSEFHAADYAVFIGVIFFSLAIGAYYAYTDRKKQSAQEYLMAGRKMPIFPVSLSLLASFLSAITMLGTPAEVYTYGTQYVAITISYCIMIPLSCFFYIPVFYDLGITSVFEYLEMRFSRCVRTSASLIFITQMTLYMAMVLYAPCLALEAVTGLNVWISVVVIGVSCTIYTTIGGMKAVMWTDAVQMGMMYAAVIAVLVQGCIVNGGFSEVWRRAFEGGRLEFFNLDLNPTTRHTLWSLSIGGTFTWTAIYAVNQAQVQRALSCPSMRNARIAMLANIPGLVIMIILCSLCGLVLFATFGHCDPLKRREIGASDQLMPLFVMKYLAIPGIPGMFVAGLFSAGLSTLSSGYNALAAVTMRDVVQNHFLHNSDDKRDAVVSKVLACVYGITCTALTYPVSMLGQLLTAALGIFGLIGGPVLGVFTLGMLIPWANWKGALVGLWTSLGFLIWIGAGFYIYNPSSPKLPTYLDQCPLPLRNASDNGTLYNLMAASLTNLTTTTTTTAPLASTSAIMATIRSSIVSFHSISYLWYSLIAVTVVIVIAMSISFLTGLTKASDVDPRLLSPPIRGFFKPSAYAMTKTCIASTEQITNNLGDSKATLVTTASLPIEPDAKDDQCDANVIDIPQVPQEDLSTKL